MSSIDPFAPFDPAPFDAASDEQPTFIKPSAGRRGSRPAAAAPPPADDLGADTSPPELGLNPLVALANPLLLAVPQLRSTRHVADPEALRHALAQSVRDFAGQAAARGIAPERVMAARYVLCTVLDEAAADTPWGGSGVWARHSLLALFHNETWGGEKVFQLMARLAQQPTAHRDLLELVYACLVLGFEGRWRMLENGRAQLDAVRDRLAQIVLQQRGPHAEALAQHWHGAPVRRRAALSWLPLAATTASVAALLAGAYAALAVSLGGLSDPVYAAIQGLRLPTPLPVVVQPAPTPRLAQFLQSDIKAGLVAVRDEVDRSVITVRGDGLFAPASATLLPQREPLMARIADALARLPGRVLVTGHTDAAPIHSARFPSNWHLSEERARTVRELLVARAVAPARISADGRADSEPVAPNDSAANKALNRRVEVTLVPGRAADAVGPIGAAPVAAASSSSPQP